MAVPVLVVPCAFVEVLVCWAELGVADLDAEALVVYFKVFRIIVLAAPVQTIDIGLVKMVVAVAGSTPNEE